MTTKRGQPGYHSPNCKLSALQQIEVIAWWRAKKELGTFKSKAREFGVSPCIIEGVITRYRKRNSA
jgi:hypothetical protein